jgi:hypothetical protein
VYRFRRDVKKKPDSSEISYNLVWFIRASSFGGAGRPRKFPFRVTF